MTKRSKMSELVYSYCFVVFSRPARPFLNGFLAL